MAAAITTSMTTTAPVSGGKIQSKYALNGQFLEPTPPVEAPWEAPLELRRQTSKNPAVQTRYRQYHQYDNTPLFGIFTHIQEEVGRIVDLGNVQMDYEVFTNLLKTWGIINDLVGKRLFRIFDYRKEKAVGVLEFMMMFEVLIAQEKQFEFIAQKLFDNLDIDSTGKLDKRRVLAVDPKKNGRSITEEQLTALKAFFAEHQPEPECIESEHPDHQVVEFDAFKEAITVRGDMLNAYIKPLLEGFAACFAQKDPPKPPMRRQRENEAYLGDSAAPFHDADAYLLAEVEKVYAKPPSEQVVDPKAGKGKGKGKGGKGGKKK